MAASREDLLSTLTPVPSSTPVEMRTDKNVIQRNEDGTITMTPLEEFGHSFHDVDHEEDRNPEDWNDNLADALSPSERMAIADELVEYYDIDSQVREEHFNRLTDGLRLLGLEDQPDSDIPFDGAATVQHPMIAEAITQFNARAIEEFFPAAGPVKAIVLGDESEEKTEQAERLEDYMNYQLTEEDAGYFWSTDQMLFYLPLSGSAFKKVYPDEITGMTTARFVTAEDLVVPYHARTLQDATRYCHRYDMWDNDVARAQEQGTFIEDARLIASPQINVDKSSTFGRYDLEDVADDRAPNTSPEDVVYEMFEYHIDYALPWDEDSEIAPPYIITIERESREVLSVRRNWRYGDATMRKRVWFVHYKYLPGLGFYGFGLLHIIGSLAKAASGSIRALLDSAAVANLQGGFKSKEAKVSGEMRFTPGEWKDVDMAADELAKSFFNLPVKEPSQALANLAQMLVEEGRRFATTTENMVGEASNQGPVGTTLALIEQGSKVFSAIHKRMHKSAREEFKLMAELNYEFMEREEYPYQIGGDEKKVLKSDFDGRVDVVPVSDPNIWSNVQRIAQAQAILEIVLGDPQIFGIKEKREAYDRMFVALKIPEYEKLLPEKEDQLLDPVSENMNFMVGNASRVFMNQDHEAHIAVHQNFAQAQAAENAELFSSMEPIIQAHIMEHMAYKYRQEVEAQLGMPLPEHDLYDTDTEEKMPAELEALISRAVAMKLRPPPPPADPEADAEAQEAAEKLRLEEEAADAKVIGELEREKAKHEQQMEHESTDFDSEQTRKDQESKREQTRKDRESRAEVRRLDRKATAQNRATFGSKVVSRPRQSGKRKKANA